MDIPPDFFDFVPPVKVESTNYGHLLHNFSAAAAAATAASSGVPILANKPFENNSLPLPIIMNKPLGLFTPPIMSSGPPPLPLVGSVGANGCASEMERLLNGQVPLIKLKQQRHDSSSVTINNNNHLNNNKSCDLSTRHVENGVHQSLIKEGNGELSSDDDGSGLSPSTSEDDEDNHPVNKKRKTKKGKVSNTNGFQFSDRLQLFPGRFPCSFCPIVWNYAPELALHESTQHGKPGNETVGSSQTTVKRRFFCPRCSFNVLGRQRYINHHLKEHLGLEVPPKSVKKAGSRSSEKIDFRECIPCDICLAPLSKTNSYAKRDHFRVYHNIKGVDPAAVERCDECPAYFLRGIQLLRHKQQFHGTMLINESTNTKRHPCQACHKRFYHLPQLWAHRRDACEMRHTFTWVATCIVDGCGLKFESTADLDYHVTNTHSSDKLKGALVECPTCGRKCVGQFGLITHMASHGDTPDGQLECQICGEKLKSRLYFNRHMKRHLNQETFEGEGENHICEQCGKMFSKKSLLDLHYEFHKDPNNWRFQCSECGKKCSTKQSLQVHTRTHTGEKPFVCQVCGEAFAYRHFLRWHVNQKHQQEGVEDNPRPYNKNSLASGGSHQGRRKDPKNSQFVCDLCSKQFSTKQALQVHGRLHTGEKPFSCQVCGDKFRYRHFLRTHVNQKHQQEGFRDLARPYRKNSDGGGPGSNGSGGDGDLIAEMKPVQQLENGNHQGNGFVCSQCSKSFSTKQAMQVHFRTHTGEKPFECQVCFERFRYRHVLRSHVNSRHEKEGVRDEPRPYNKRTNNASGGGGSAS